jgi:hypothetical protein
MTTVRSSVGETTRAKTILVSSWSLNVNGTLQPGVPLPRLLLS